MTAHRRSDLAEQVAFAIAALHDVVVDAAPDVEAALLAIRDRLLAALFRSFVH